MRPTTLELLACPACHTRLEYYGADKDTPQSGSLICDRCNRTFNITDGIPHFIEFEQLNGFNRRFARAYDWFSWGYALFSKIAFAYIGMNEEIGRREITDRLDPRGGRVLEVSIGPGVNLPYLVDRLDIGEIFGLDISLGQLQRCQSYVRRKRWDVELFLGNAECLPFQDDSFDGVFHVGGINFFNDKKAAVDEMIRVAKPGARILIADETERGAKAYEKISPGFKNAFDGKRDAIIVPVDLVPQAMLEKQVVDVWKGWLYCIEFRKP
jgi:ubiquinone/menaquinone biosynthesis C-methylase UbiE/uncharacterized protein YbaR (Trm112 family)